MRVVRIPKRDFTDTSLDLILKIDLKGENEKTRDRNLIEAYNIKYTASYLNKRFELEQERNRKQ